MSHHGKISLHWLSTLTENRELSMLCQDNSEGSKILCNSLLADTGKTTQACNFKGAVGFFPSKLSAGYFIFFPTVWHAN